jgi:hypothetical protein
MALLNLALSFKSLDWLAFRTWESAVSAHCPSSIGPFEPGSVYRKERAYGDLANMGNMADLRQYRSEEFTVDRYGFRNPPSVQNSQPVGFVVGDSFTAGAGNSDRDTLPEQLSRNAGAFFYNAGTITGDLANAEVVASTLHLAQGTVVYELLERTARKGPSFVEAERQICTDGGFAGSGPIGRSAALFLSDHSPAVLLSRRLVKVAENDSLLPNPYRRYVARGRLRNGQELLFFPDDLRSLTNEQQLTLEWRWYFVDLRRRMAARNLKLVVLLVPNKYTVYGPLLKERPGDQGGARFLSALEGALLEGGVATVNLTERFQISAAESLASNEYLYWRDDTHWSPSGIKQAAEILWSQIQAKDALNKGD